MVSSESMLASTVLVGGDFCLSSRPFLAAGCEVGWTGLLRLLADEGSAFTPATQLGIVFCLRDNKVGRLLNRAIEISSTCCMPYTGGDLMGMKCTNLSAFGLR